MTNVKRTSTIFLALLTCLIANGRAEARDKPPTNQPIELKPSPEVDRLEVDHRPMMSTRIHLDHGTDLRSIIGEIERNPARYGYRFEGIFRVIQREARKKLRKAMKNFVNEGPLSGSPYEYLEHVNRIERLGDVLADYGSRFPRTLAEATNPDRNPEPTVVGERTTLFTAGPFKMRSDLKVEIEKLDVDLFDAFRDESLREDYDEAVRARYEDRRRTLASVSVLPRRKRGNLLNTSWLTIDGKLAFKLRAKEDYVDSIVSSVALRLKFIFYNEHRRPMAELRIRVRAPKQDVLSVTFALISIEL